MRAFLILFFAILVAPAVLLAGSPSPMPQSANAAEFVDSGSSDQRNLSTTSLTIPSGTILPVRLNSTLSSVKSKAGQEVTGRIMQDVPLVSGWKVREGARITGHLIEVTPKGAGHGPRITLQFDKLIFSHHSIPITTNLRVIAGFMQINEAQIPPIGPSESDVYRWLTTVQIGGDVVYGEGGTVTSADNPNDVVGKSVDGGVLGRARAKAGTKCRGAVDRNDRPQALWLFSADACGTYGLEHIGIAHAGRTDPIGVIVLVSDGGNLKVPAGAGMLLRVIASRVDSASRAHQGVFSNPQRVTIRGYSGDAMEPFLTRDGKYLFFNNLNEPTVNTDLYWAERIDDLTFQFKGEVGGVNTPALEGVPSMDRDSNFYFISPRSYEQTASTIYRGHFSNGVVTEVALVPGVSLAKPGIVNFDAEISADGNTLYFVESQFDRSGHPRTARILFARRNGNGFVRAEESARILQTINTDTLNYAVATSPSELEIFFTRLDPGGPAIYEATRPDPAAPFGTPAKIESITGFVEGPTFSPDERMLYYHKKENGHFVLYRVTRN